MSDNCSSLSQYQISDFEDEEFLQMKNYEDDDDVDDDDDVEISGNAEKMSDEMS